jgi:hypothetical protein
MTVKAQSSTFLSFILPRLQDVLFISLFVAVIGLGPRIFNLNGDLGKHITIGEYILDTWRIPTTDLFSHTLYGQPLIPHEWGAQLVFGLIHRIAGLDGVVWLSALLIAWIFTLVYKLCVDRSGLVLVALAATILAALVSSLGWQASPHLFTMLFVVIWVYGLERLHWGNPLDAWFFPLVMLIWVNMDNDYTAGFVLLGVYLAGDLLNALLKLEPSVDSTLLPHLGILTLLKNYLLVGGLSFLATFLNPAVWRIWGTSIGNLGGRFLVSRTIEFLSPNFNQMSTWPFLLMLLTSLIILGLNRRRISMIALLMIAWWTAVSLYNAQNIPIYAVLLAPFLSNIAAREINFSQMLVGFTALQMRLLKVETSLRGFFWPLLFVSVLGFASYQRIPLDFDVRGNQFYPEIFPVSAVDNLVGDLPAGPVFNYYPWGGYLLYRLWPSELVFIDGQENLHEGALAGFYEQVVTLNGDWQKVLDRYQVSWVLMPADSLLVRTLKEQPGWDVIYEDDTSGILVRSSQEPE